MGYGAKCFRVSWRSGSPVQQIISGAYAAEALLREQKRPRRHCSCATYNLQAGYSKASDPEAERHA